MALPLQVLLLHQLCRVQRLWRLWRLQRPLPRVRRRLLRIVDEPDDGADEGTLRLSCRKRDREYRVRAVDAAEVAAGDVEARLAALLWSGDAA